MEYPFKDLLPLDEVLEREGYYKDWTHLDPEVFYSLTQISEYIKTKGYGVDVRLLIAQLAEHFGLKTTQVVDLGNLLQAEHTSLKQQVQQAVAQVNADRNALATQFNQSVAQMEADKNAVIANATIDSEVILARGGKATLGQRLDETTAQLAQTESYLTENRNAHMPLDIPTYDGGGQTTHPSYVYSEQPIGAFTHWLAHTPYPKSADSLENPSIVGSHDGINWSTPPGLTNPIDQPTPAELSEGIHMSDVELIIKDGMLELYYRYTHPPLDKIMRKRSSDGVTWSEREVVYDAFSTGEVMLSPSIIYENGKYKMWYVSVDRNVYLRESVTGANGTWSEKKIVPITYKSGIFRPWHLEVRKDVDGSYLLLLNAFRGPASAGTYTRDLLLGKSVDGLSFENVELLLTPSRKGWDNEFIYRATMAKSNLTYKLYYSAMGTGQNWKIGLIEGKTPETLGSIDIVENGFYKIPQINTNVMHLGNFFENSEGAFLSNAELSLFERNVGSVKLKVGQNNSLIIANEGGDLATLSFQEDFLKIPKATTDLLHVGDFYEVSEGAYLSHKELSLFELGVGGIKLKVGKNNMVSILREDGNDVGNLEVGTIVISETPNINRAGAIRFNSTTKKHEAYDGTKWHVLY